MGDPNRESRQVDFQKLQDDTENAQILSEKISDLKYNHLNEMMNRSCRQDTEKLLKSYIKFYLLLQPNSQNPDEFELRLSEFELFMNDILHEWKKILFIERRQNVVKEIQNLKLRLYAVTTSDTCTDFMAKLAQYADDLVRELERDNVNKRFPDLFQDLEELIAIISIARKNTQNQVYIESVSGVLTLGASAASGVLGTVAIAGRSATIASKVVVISPTTVANSVFAGKCVTSAAGLVIDAVNVGSAISNSMGSNENTSSHAQHAANGERFERLYTMIRYMSELDRNVNVEAMALEVFKQMTKDEIDKLYP